MNKKLRGSVLVSLLLFASYLAWADTVTVSTYYPSPYGSYQNLDATADTHLATTSGGVSIGKATNAGSALDVKGAGAGEVLMGQWISDARYAGLGLANSLAAGNYNFLSSPTDTNLYINRPTGKSISFRESNADQMTLVSGGDLGIGTTTPAARLHVIGTASNTQGDGVVKIGAGGMNARADLGVLAAPNQYPYLQAITTGGSNYNLLLNPFGGNVGIGTTTTDTQLNVIGAVSNNQGDGIVKIGAKFTNARADLGVLAGPNQYPYLQAITTGGSNYNLLLNPFGGNVGVGMTTLTNTNQLEVNGNVYASGAVTWASDARFKTDIPPLHGILSKLDDLQAVTYERSKLAVSLGQPAGRKEIGIVGQELEKIFPELVLRNGPEEYRSVDYGRLSIVLLEAVKELKADLVQMQTERDALSKKYDALAQRLSALETR